MPIKSAYPWYSIGASVLQFIEVDEFDAVLIEKIMETPTFNSSPLKNGGWKTVLSFWVSAYCQGFLLNFGRVLTALDCKISAQIAAMMYLFVLSKDD